jgi:PhnB protein
MQPIPYLFYKGTCHEAFTAYAEIFGCPAPEIFAFKDMPDEAKASMPGVPDEMVMHASLSLSGSELYGSDDPSGDTPAMSGCNIHLSFPSVEEATRVFTALSEGGEVRMPIGPTFWAPAFGTCSDKWGIRWMIAADPAPDA